MKNILKTTQYHSKVSSVLNKDVKLFGGKNMFDNNEETCWNSGQGTPQWIEVEFDEEETVCAFQIQFQGGFVGCDCHVEVGPKNTSLKKTEPFYPEDSNCIQWFKLKNSVKTKVVRLVFNSSSDLFGRVIVYKLEIYGPG